MKWVRGLVIAGALWSTSAARAQRGPEFIVMPHSTGSLALRTSEIASLWYQAVAGEKPSQLRIVSPALSEVKTLAGAEADGLWRSVEAGVLASRFVITPHMDGRLAIPRQQIRTAFYSEPGGQAQLRLVYEGDPSGKTVTGGDATRIWQALNQP
jgi:hypothetical protein